jgi:hypothetical protein
MCVCVCVCVFISFIIPDIFSQVPDTLIMPIHRLRNRPINEQERSRIAAKRALAIWYLKSYHAADIAIPMIQAKENLLHVSAISNWRELKDVKDGYVMLQSLLSGTSSPVILKLDDSSCGPGKLTYRGLHERLRIHLKLNPTDLLLLCPDRPWYRYLPEGVVIPGGKVLSDSDDSSCKRQILGTTLLFYVCVPLSEDKADSTSS